MIATVRITFGFDLDDLAEVMGCTPEEITNDDLIEQAEEALVMTRASDRWEVIRESP